MQDWTLKMWLEEPTIVNKEDYIACSLIERCKEVVNQICVTLPCYSEKKKILSSIKYKGFILSDTEKIDLISLYDSWAISIDEIRYKYNIYLSRTGNKRENKSIECILHDIEAYNIITKLKW